MIKFSRFKCILFLIIVILSSCGKKDSVSVINPTVKKEYSSINELMNGLDIQYKVGQYKKISQHHQLKIGLEDSVGGWCDYWENVSNEVVGIKDNNVIIRTIIISDPWEENYPECPRQTGEEVDNVSKYNIEDLQSEHKEFIRFYTDAEYRCSELSACRSAKFISAEEKILNGQAYAVIKTQYQFDDGKEYLLESTVSTRNIFEGVVEYNLSYINSGKWILKRFLNISRM